MNTLTQKQLEKGLTDKDKQTIFFERAKARLSDKPVTDPMIPRDQMRDHLENLAKASRDLNLSINTEISLWYVIGILDFMLEQKEQKSFTVQTAEKTDPGIRILRKSNYGRQPIPEIVKNLTAIAESKCINQPAPREASLWNAIEILEDLEYSKELRYRRHRGLSQINIDEKERNINEENNSSIQASKTK